MSNIFVIDRLSNAFKKIKGLGLKTEKVTVCGVEFTLRSLTPDETRHVNMYVSDYIKLKYDNKELDTLSILEVFTLRTIEPLCYSIISIDEMDFHDVLYVEDGQDKMEKHVWMRNYLATVDMSVVEVLHDKYNDILRFANEASSKDITFRDPKDELRNLEMRRAELRDQMGLEEEAAPQASSEEEEAPEFSKNLREAAFKRLEEPKVGPESEEPLEEEEPPRFIRLDKPEVPYSDEEMAGMEEQERLYQNRALAQAKLQKARQPLNQEVPQIVQPATEQVVTRRQDTSNIPIAEGYEDVEPYPLEKNRK